MFNLQSQKIIYLIFYLKNWFQKETDLVTKGKLVILECEKHLTTGTKQVTEMSEVDE